MSIIADLVHQSSTTTGTGNFTLAALNGRRSFNTAFGNGTATNVFYYYITHQAAVEWEHGTGHMSSSTVLVRDTVIASSNANAAVNFSSGTKDVMCDQPANARRERVTSARTYYVRTDGSNSNTGLQNTSGGAFLTIQYAINYATQRLDMAAGVTIQVGNGTYAEDVTIQEPVTAGGGYIGLVGDTTTPSNVVIAGTGAAVTVSNCAGWYMEGFKITSSGGNGIVVNDAIFALGKIEYGSIAVNQIAVDAGSNLDIYDGYSITASAARHLLVTNNSYVDTGGITVTLTGTPAFGADFVAVLQNATYTCSGMTFSGSATGQRYTVNMNGVINTNGGGANYFPGNSAGSAATGGQYA